MGSCLGKKGAQVQIVEDFRKDKSCQDNTIDPIPTTLYNTLRKTKDLQIIREQGKPLFKNQTSPNFSELRPSSLKMLYSFKNIVWVGKKSQNLKMIQQNTNPKQLIVISEGEAEKFLKNFPIFSCKDTHKYRTAEIPLLVFCSGQILEKHKHDDLKIFLHTNQNKNEAVYKALNINETIFDADHKNAEKLEKCHAHRVVYCHQKEAEHNQLLKTLATAIIKRYGTDQLATKIYLRKSLPHTQLMQPANDNLSTVVPKTPERERTKQQMTVQEQQKRLLQKLYKELGSDLQKLERAHNLLITLLSNIYTNKESQNYRKVRKTNKQINEMLGKYSSGVGLLKLNGFEDENGFYVNKMEGRYLKIYRTDLDLAYRNLVNEKNQN